MAYEKRKTIQVEQVKDWVNTRLAVTNSSLSLNDLTPQQAFRLGAASLLEQILHATNNYRGFGYLESEYLPVEQRTLRTVLKPDYDRTRRSYI